MQLDACHNFHNLLLAQDADVVWSSGWDIIPSQYAYILAG